MLGGRFAVRDTLLTRLAYRWSPRRTLLGVPTGVFFITSVPERELIFGRVQRALALIQEYSPVRFRQLQRDVACIFVFGDASTVAQYLHELRMCEFFINYMLAPTTSDADVASSLVHEATHARLARLGIGREAASHRIEHACHHAERAFGKRLPAGEEVVAAAEERMGLSPSVFSPDARAERRAKAFYRLAIPRWLAATGASWIRFRARWASSRSREGAAQREDAADEGAVT